jgi:hypothetical protein
LFCRGRSWVYSSFTLGVHKKHLGWLLIWQTVIRSIWISQNDLIFVGMNVVCWISGCILISHLIHLKSRNWYICILIFGINFFFHLLYILPLKKKSLWTKLLKKSIIKSRTTQTWTFNKKVSTTNPLKLYYRTSFMITF